MRKFIRSVGGFPAKPSVYYAAVRWMRLEVRPSLVGQQPGACVQWVFREGQGGHHRGRAHRAWRWEPSSALCPLEIGEEKTFPTGLGDFL